MPAHAARIGARERAAKKACLIGDAAKGTEILAELYLDTDDPTYIYNQGRCYEQNNRYEEAIGRFREYLRKKPRATEAERADAEKHIADCQALLPPQEVPVTPVAPPPEPPLSPLPAEVQEPAAAAAPPPPPKPPIEVLVVAPASPAEGDRGSGMRVGGIATLGVGAAALMGGVAMNLKHNGMIADLQKRYTPQTDDSSKTYKTLALVGYGVGAACLAGGALLYYLGWRAGHVSVAPVPVAAGTAVILKGEF